MTIQDIYPTRSGREPVLLYRIEDPVVHGTATDGLVSAEELETYEDNGFLSVEELLEPAELAECQNELNLLLVDESLDNDERVVREKGSNEIRSIFEVHKISEIFSKIISDERVAGRARQVLGSDVYIHQSRVNYKPGFNGNPFYWHSDFETWHAEDGMPRMRALSVSIALTDNYSYNGALMIMPGSHKTFVSCVGETPEDHYRESLKEQEIGTPDQTSLAVLGEKHGIEVFTGPAGSATIFDCNCMHGSNGNITPFPRSNIFVVFNSVENTCVEPFSASKRRPEFIGARDFAPLSR
ncbi:MAG: ectoine hydroxylase [Stackebrandtia sp.]